MYTAVWSTSFAEKFQVKKGENRTNTGHKLQNFTSHILHRMIEVMWKY